MTSQPNLYGAPLNGVWPAGQLHPSDIAFDGAPVAAFRLTLDAPWIERGYDHWYTAYRRKVNPWLVALIVGVAVALLAYFGARTDTGIATPFACLLVGAFWGLATRFIFFRIGRAGRWATVQQFRRSMDFETAHSFA